MQAAVKLTVKIPESRTVELKLPDEVPMGTAEVIVLISQQAPPASYPQDALRGTVEIVGDILAPVLPAGAWDAERGELA